MTLIKVLVTHACMQVRAGCADKQKTQNPLCYCGAALSELDATAVAAGALDGQHYGRSLPEERLTV